MSRVALLDVNVLVALFDPDHIHHEAAHRWFAAERGAGWATCAITESGVLRVLSNPAYSSAALRPREIAEHVARMIGSGNHTFWSESISLSDPARFELGAVASYRQITDAYLLGLALRNDGRLATFDRAIPLRAVAGATAQHLALIPA